MYMYTCIIYIYVCKVSPYVEWLLSVITRTTLSWCCYRRFFVLASPHLAWGRHALRPGLRGLVRRPPAPRQLNFSFFSSCALSLYGCQGVTRVGPLIYCVRVEYVQGTPVRVRPKNPLIVCSKVHGGEVGAPRTPLRVLQRPPATWYVRPLMFSGGVALTNLTCHES